jgi:large subunit ribosomal protein L4
MRRLALRCVLSDKAGSGALKVVEGFDFSEPKTAEMTRILAALGSGPSTLVVTGEPEINVIKSASNVTGVKTLPAAQLNVADVLNHRTMVITVDAVRKAEEFWGQSESQGEIDAPV